MNDKSLSPMGYVYINESFSDSTGIKNVDTCKRNDLFYVTFDTNLQDFDVENRNHRYLHAFQGYPLYLPPK